MSSPLRRGRDAVVIVLLLALPFFVLRANVRDPRRLNALDRLVLRLSAPLQYVGSLVGRGISSVVGSYVYLVDVKKDNEGLKHDNAVLRERVRKLEGLEVENRRFRELLKLREQLGPEALTAQVIAKEGTEFHVARLQLDRPSTDIRPGWPVLDEQGVVGVVQRVEGDSLEVQLAIDPQLAIDVVDERTGARGIARGTTDVDRYACRVEYMKRSDEVSVGDLLVTSGVGARFAKNLPVARITKIHNRGFGEFQEVEAEPVVSFSRLEEVLVLPPVGAGGDKGATGPTAQAGGGKPGVPEKK
ncbi:MAG: rod shape-determining protein MreC [Polyangiales bacterium]